MNKLFKMMVFIMAAIGFCHASYKNLDSISSDSTWVFSSFNGTNRGLNYVDTIPLDTNYSLVYQGYCTKIQYIYNHQMISLLNQMIYRTLSDSSYFENADSVILEFTSAGNYDSIPLHITLDRYTNKNPKKVVSGTNRVAFNFKNGTMSSVFDASAAYHVELDMIVSQYEFLVADNSENGYKSLDVSISNIKIYLHINDGVSGIADSKKNQVKPITNHLSIDGSHIKMNFNGFDLQGHKIK